MRAKTRSCQWAPTACADGLRRWPTHRGPAGPPPRLLGKPGSVPPGRADAECSRTPKGSAVESSGVKGSCGGRLAPACLPGIGCGAEPSCCLSAKTSVCSCLCAAETARTSSKSRASKAEASGAARASMAAARHWQRAEQIGACIPPSRMAPRPPLFSQHVSVRCTFQRTRTRVSSSQQPHPCRPTHRAMCPSPSRTHKRHQRAVRPGRAHALSSSLLSHTPLRKGPGIGRAPLPLL